MEYKKKEQGNALLETFAITYLHPSALTHCLTKSSQDLDREYSVSRHL